MTETKTIRLLVSCPGDVTQEKDEIIRICKDFSEANHGRSNIAFMVLDWRTFVGEYGERPQKQLNEHFGIYDVYVGILWKRFGTPPNSINQSGRENESGTEEEFFEAIEQKKIFGRPKIHFFIKNYDRNIENLQQAEQIVNVFKFIEDQKRLNNNYLNTFESKESFNSCIIKLLKSIEDGCVSSFIDSKRVYSLTEETKFKILRYQPEVIGLPSTYLNRTILHFKFLIDNLNEPYLESKMQSLDELMISTQRVVLLGDAGSGKSTELKNLAHRLKENNSNLIPLFQQLNSYTPDLGIERFLPDWWKDVPNELLLIIWDGLDEIEPKDFISVTRQIKTFTENHSEIRILISCRTNFYELPTNNSIGTLDGFEPYFINDLTLKDAKEYYENKFCTINSDTFISQVVEKNLIDLTNKPFFLMLLADRFSTTHKLMIDRAELFEMFLLNRIILDQNHFKTTVDLKSIKQDVLLLLQKVALGMEILSKNQINESEILDIISSAELNSLKYFTAFKKKDGSEDVWQFEHNNIQEYLAAKALSNYDFDKVIQLIAFAPNYKKLLPTWFNTLSFLFSIIEPESKLYEKLLQWMLLNEKEVIVKFETDKIADNLKVQIFQGIFNYYKTYDVWISSNKFNDTELARFGQSFKNILFLIDEVKNVKNTRTAKINALRLLGHFQFNDVDIFEEVRKLLLRQIDQNLEDPNFIYSVLYSLKWSGHTDANTINLLMEKIGNKKNQYIRAGMYSILLKSNLLSNYVSYLIEGYELKDKKIIGERDEVSFMDEWLSLRQCLKSIKSSEGIMELVRYISGSTSFKFKYDSKKIIESLITNAISAYFEEDAVYNAFLSWFMKDDRDYSLEISNLIIHFFNHTNTRERAFFEIWNLEKVPFGFDNSLTIAKLLTPKLAEFVINEYLHQKLASQELIAIYHQIKWINNESLEYFETLIKNNTDVEIQKPLNIDHEAVIQVRQKTDFDLLFDADTFKESTLKVFEKEGKVSLSYEELFEVRKENNKWINMENYYSSVALRLLRDLVDIGQSISKESVLRWFEEPANVEWYRISLIFDYLINRKGLEVDNDQKLWLTKWCITNVSKVDFKKAIETEEGRTTYNTMAMYIFYFSNRFNILHSTDALLDMLSFDFFEGQDWIGIDYQLSNLKSSEIIERMLNNINDGISDSSVLVNHVKYLAKNKIGKSYRLILNEIVNENRSEYLRKDLLDTFFKYTSNTDSIKAIFFQADSLIIWELVDILKANNEELFVEDYLLKILENSTNRDEMRTASEKLISLQNIKGLEYYVGWVKSHPEYDFDDSYTGCLSRLTKIQAIPYLIELLEISYIREIKENHFNRLNNEVLGAFHNIALVSEDNFLLVKSKLQEFMKDRSSVHKEVKYILFNIEKMEENCYRNNVQSFNINQVKEKLELLRL